MASRVRIAAAACVVAAGLFVGGAGATMAFADPESSNVDAKDGTPSNDEPDDPSADATAGRTPSDQPTTGPGSATGATGSASRPTSRFGHSRHGHQAGTPSSGTAEPSASKLPEPSSTSTPQTIATEPGEPTGTASQPDLTARGHWPHPTKTDPTKTDPTKTDPTKTDPTKTPEPTNTEPTKTTTATTSGVPVPGDPGHQGTPDPDDPKGGDDGDDGEDDHHPGWGLPWWGPCPGEPGRPPHGPPPGQPPGSGGGGGGGGGGQPQQPPIGRPGAPPAMQLPAPVQLAPQLPGVAEPVVDAVTGLATAAAQLPFAPLTLPVIVAPIGVPGVPGAGGAGAGGAGPRPGAPAPPRPPGELARPQEKPAQQNPPGFQANYGGPAESFRAGYGDYLRSAGIGKMMAIAVPGLVGIIVLTSAGGLLGYRQARAGHTVRVNGTSRFMG